ncbi:MAG: alpha/beta hydrolase [Deltaproteobacteria bacterium]|nr:alpha/beta hydrolase [Deltaproteobacteria bacterium]
MRVFCSLNAFFVFLPDVLDKMNYEIRMKPVAPTDPKGRLLSTINGPLHVVEEGPEDGVPLLLFHGIPGSVRDFRYLGPELAKVGVRSIRVDAPGFGATPWESFPHSAQLARGQWVELLLNALDVDDALLGAHSFGGTTAMTAAALFPERIRGLVLMNTPGLRRHQGLRFVPPSVLKILAKGFSHRRAGPLLSDAMRKSYMQIGLKGVEKLTHDDIHHHAQLVGDLHFRNQRWAARTLECPTFIFSGGKDPIVESEICFHLAESIAKGGRNRVEHHHFRKGGHYLQRDQAPFIARTLSRAIENGLAA